jgi:cytochrome c-type biogenesis protein CcmH
VKYLQALILLIALFAPTRLWAVEPSEMLSDPTLEARARALSKELRCMVCQNESIDDSGAPLAHDLRVLVRERIKAGDSDAQVLDFLVARYGEFVLVGAVVILVDLRRRRSGQAVAEQADLTAAEEARLAELLRDRSAT